MTNTTNRFFTTTATGYAHTREGRPCQDWSASYQDPDMTVVTTCDGHGGRIYIRSDRGSRFACRAVLETFRDMLTRSNLRRIPEQDLADKIRIHTLCAWNKLVEQDYSDHPIHKNELEGLSEEQIFKLKTDPAKAYGTTLIGAAVFAGRLFCIRLGDGGLFLVKNGACRSAFPELEDDEETVANITDSMCQPDAYRHLSCRIYDWKCTDAVLLCTDGVINPYRSLPNFEEAFVRPVMCEVEQGHTGEVCAFIRTLGEERGIGDDVSLGVISHETFSLKYYRAPETDPSGKASDAGGQPGSGTTSEHLVN